MVNIEKALDQAQEAELDLVELAPHSDPPVCKLMDYGKYLFEQEKKQQAAKKNQKKTQVKEVKFRPGTDVGDYRVKLRNLIKFLENGDKVKVSIRFRGREMSHQELGKEMMSAIESDTQSYATVEQRPSMEGRQMIMMLSPIKKK